MCDLLVYLSTLYYYEVNDIFGFSLIIFFQLEDRPITCIVPGCRPHPGTSRFKFPKNKKKKKAWLNSLKTDETNEIHVFPHCENPVFPKNKVAKCSSEQTRSLNDKKFETKRSIYFLIID